MYRDFKISPPFFEIGPKAYIYGEDVLKLAKHADRLTAKYNVQIIFTPQYVDIPLVVQGTKNLLVFAQHMDFLPVGRGVGSVLPEAVHSAGAKGVLLNHAEKKLSLDVLECTIRRADQVGLASMACADNINEAAVIASMHPNIIIAESPDQIGTGKRAENDRQTIAEINKAVWAIDPEIRVLHGAGINCGQDVYNVISAGAQAVGSSSGILKSDNPFSMLDEMISSVRAAWDNTQ